MTSFFRKSAIPLPYACWRSSKRLRRFRPHHEMNCSISPDARPSREIAECRKAEALAFNCWTQSARLACDKGPSGCSSSLLIKMLPVLDKGFGKANASFSGITAHPSLTSFDSWRRASQQRPLWPKCNRKFPAVNNWPFLPGRIYMFTRGAPLAPRESNFQTRIRLFPNSLAPSYGVRNFQANPRPQKSDSAGILPTKARYRQVG